MKSRYRSNGPTKTDGALIRNLDNDPPPFDLLVALVLNADFSVRHAWQLAVSEVRRHAVYRAHVNGWLLKTVRGGMLDDPEIAQFELRMPTPTGPALVSLRRQAAD